MKRLLALLLVSIAFPVSAWAQTTVAVTGTVPSVVDANQSTVTTDLTELPADGKSMAIITVTLKDGSGSPVSNKTVTAASNRGDVDVLGVYINNNLTTNKTTTSDTNGTALFAIRSNAPGLATITAIGDGVTLSTKPQLTFSALPVLQNLTISVKVPEIIPGTTKITLVSPPPTASSSTANNSQLVNTKVELQLPFFLLGTASVVFLVILTLIIMLFAIRRRLKAAMSEQRKAAAKEQELLKKIVELENSISANQQQLAKNDQVLSQKIDQAIENKS